MKPKKLKMALRLVPCKRCGHEHADWWRSTPAPGCEERVKRGL